MNVLVLTAYPPVLQMHGGGVRMYHNIRILSRSHVVHVISFVENDDDCERLRSIDGICASVKAVRRIPDFSPHWLSLDPFLVREFSTPEMYKAVNDVCRAKDIHAVQCEYLQMAQYRPGGTLSILTIHETLSANAYAAFKAESDAAAKFKLYYRWMQMLRYEVMASRKFDRVVTMTEHDAAYLHSYMPSADIRAIPIGIDTAEFFPFDEEPGRPIEVLFVGNFRHTPNAEAARFVVQELAPFFPGVRFILPGNDVPEMPAFRNVVFPGYVAGTRSLYHRPNTIVVAPLFSGTGQRVKLLEALSMACPVITTALGGLGLPIRHDMEALIAESAEEFRAALSRLISSEPLRWDLGANGREMICRRFDWEHIAPQMLHLLDA